MKKIFLIIIALYQLGIPFMTMAISANELLPKIGKTEETGNVQALPTPSDPELYGRIVQIMLGVATAGILITFAVAGIMMVVSRGNPETFGKAKDLIMYALIGVAIVATAYAISIGVTKLPNLFVTQ